MCLGLLALPGAARWSWAASADGDALLRRGGVVLALRHALAPGVYDPPQFKLGDCSTQRNLNDEGRAQARQIGTRMRAAGLAPARVRTSPWCRCRETAALAFGNADDWSALGSPRAGTDETNAESLRALRAGVAEAARQPGRFEVWVTHMFVLAALVDGNASSGEGLILGPGADGGVRVLGRWG